MRQFARLVNGEVRMMGYEEAWKLALRQNPSLRVVDGYRVKVGPQVKVVRIPRKHHYAKTVKTEESKFSDTREECVVKRGVFGFGGLHECKYHRKGAAMGPVFIEEINALAT